MTYSLQLKNGDLTIGAKGLGTVDNENKIIQDLSNELKTKMGDDPLNPSYGSLINGGITPDGFAYESLIGENDLALVELRVRSEILRIISNYQERQLARARADKMRYNKQSLTRGEIVLGLDSIEVKQSLDKLSILIKIISGNNSPLTIEMMLNA